MRSQLFSFFVCLIAGVLAIVVACGGDRFGELVVADAGYLQAPAAQPSAEAGAAIPGPASTGRPSDLGATPPVFGDKSAPLPSPPQRVDAGVDGGSTPSDASSDAVPVDADLGDTVPSVCDFTGTWASRVIIDVSWVPQGLMGAILAPGNGQIKQWVLSTRAVTGQTTTDTAIVCGIALPDFSGTQVAGGEKYGIQFPSSTFDKGVLPSFAISGSILGSGPGASYSSAPSAVLLGLTLPNPTTDPWPSSVTTAVDSDQDGVPGVTALVTQGSGYSDVIVDTVGDRADKIYVAMRQITSVTAKAADCDTFTGAVSIPQVTDTTGTTKYAIDSHVLGCRLDGDAGDCYPVQASFVDATQPVFSPSGNTSFTSLRVVSGATCATVRQQLP
jgi:hypothetical protein